MIPYQAYIQNLKDEIVRARSRAMLSVNRELILLYWKIGKTILEMQEKEGWGSKVIEVLSQDLKKDFPEMRGLGVRNLVYMRTFFKACPDYEFTQEVPAQIPWYHNQTILDKVHDTKIRCWYIQKTIENSWSRSVLVQQIESKLYERQAGVKKLSNFEKTLPKPLSSLAQDIMKDSYDFTFLGLPSSAPEQEIEITLEQKVSKLLLEMGSGFSYMGRQYPLKVGEQSFAIDMLFYNVKLRCYCAIELKAKDFKPADVGQLNFYLTAMDDQLKQPEDNPSIGLLICPAKDKLVAEYALRNIQNPMGISAFQLSEVLPEEFKTGVKA